VADKDGLWKSSATKILAVSSPGGHWIQLNRLFPVFSKHETVFVTTNPNYRPGISLAKFYSVIEATRKEKLNLIIQLVEIFYILLRERPDVVISTGASCGFFGLFFGKLLGARTIWIDSIANTQILSLSGRLVAKFADLWLTQWPELSTPKGPEYKGRII